MNEKFSSVWDALFDDPGEKAVLEIKSKLMRAAKTKRRINEVSIEYLIKEVISKNFVINIKLIKEKNERDSNV